MDRRKIESLTAGLAVFLLFVVTIGAVIAFANTFFNWDIFPPDVEKVLGFIFASCVVIIVSSVLVNIMLSLSIIAINSDVLVKKVTEGREKNAERE